MVPMADVKSSSGNVVRLVHWRHVSPNHSPFAVFRVGKLVRDAQPLNAVRKSVQLLVLNSGTAVRLAQLENALPMLVTLARLKVGNVVILAHPEKA